MYSYPTMPLYELVGVDVDGARYCLACAPMSADEAEHEGIGGPVFVEDVCPGDCCDACHGSLY